MPDLRERTGTVPMLGPSTSRSLDVIALREILCRGLSSSDEAFWCEGTTAAIFQRKSGHSYSNKCSYVKAGTETSGSLFELPNLLRLLWRGLTMMDSVPFARKFMRNKSCRYENSLSSRE